MKRGTPAEVEQDIDALRALDIKALRDRWRAVLKTVPPPKVQSGFLRLAIAYRLQELVYGGLKPDAVRQLRKHAKSIEARSSGAAEGPMPGKVVSFDARRSLSPGTRLMREWNGSTELVDVVEGGFVWRGKTFRTLSATAVAITGTKWSGPKFFGLIRTNSARPKQPATQALTTTQLQGEAA